MTTAAPATTHGRSGWMRTMVLTIGIALLGLTLLPPAAGASMNQGNIHANAMFQISLCEAGGGHADVSVNRNGNGIVSIQVKCNGGVYDGMFCDNSFYGVDCSGAFPRPGPFNPGSHLWQLEEVIPVLETGSFAQIEHVLADVEAAYDLRPVQRQSAESPDEQHQDQDMTHGKSKHKQGKQGKHGKGHKK